jgi:transmembrane sensor
MDSARQIEQQAAAWLAKRDSGSLSESDEACLKAWIEEATAHRIAYLRLEMVWKETQRLKSVAAGLPTGFGEKNNWTLPFFDPRQLMAAADPKMSMSAADELDAAAFPLLPAAGESGLRASGSVRGRVWAAAAAVVLSIGAACLGYGLLTGGQYATQVGVVTSVPLADGSSMILNTASKVRVDLNPQERRVDLTRGEAYFDVVKDPERPFVVTAGDKRITAIGTAFSVKRENGELRVVVTEGKVLLQYIDAPKATQHLSAGTGERRGVREITQSTSPSSQSRGIEGEVLLLAAGTIARTQKDTVLVQKATPPLTEEVLSWRTGYLMFRDTPLQEAIEQFNQYNARKLVTNDPELARIPLTGKFKATNYPAFVRLLEEGYAIKADQHGDTITLAR